jgi:hypothetical protein
LGTEVLEIRAFLFRNGDHVAMIADLGWWPALSAGRTPETPIFTP